MESIFDILHNDHDIQEQWKNISRIHSTTKKYLLLAEEICEDGVVFLQPLKEHRDAYDHVIRIFTTEIKNLPADFNKISYIKSNLNKAYGHEYRAFFDTADWLTYNLRKMIRTRIQRMSILERHNYDSFLKKTMQSNLQSVKNLLNEYPFKISEQRMRKDVTPDNSYDAIKEYISLVDELIHIYRITPF